MISRDQLMLRLCPGRGRSSGAGCCLFPRNGGEMVKQRLRQQVILPSNLRMPLHSENKLLGPRIDDRLDHPIRSPGYWLEIPADDIDGLMMMAVDGSMSRFGEPRDQRIFSDVDRVRPSREHIALHVFKRFLDFALNILN